MRSDSIFQLKRTYLLHVKSKLRTFKHFCQGQFYHIDSSNCSSANNSTNYYFCYAVIDQTSLALNRIVWLFGARIRGGWVIVLLFSLIISTVLSIFDYRIAVLFGSLLSQVVITLALSITSLKFATWRHDIFSSIIRRIVPPRPPPIQVPNSLTIRFFARTSGNSPSMPK